MTATGTIIFKGYVKLGCQSHGRDKYLLRLIMWVNGQTGPFKELNQVVTVAQALLLYNPGKAFNLYS